jgi:serine phosphatase RsbU (regulator of sigma subunit)/CheY-like chemotaxis protein
MATVLIVDDDPVSREFMRTLLDYGGHRTCEAADGDSALRLVDQEPPDAVITDVLMPGLDGYELARRLRSRRATSHIPIAFSTAHYGRDEIQPLARACGVQDVIFKPAQPTTVMAAIDALLAGGRGTGGQQVTSAREFDDQHRLALKAKLLEMAGTLRLSEGRLHAIANTAPVGLLLADGTGSASYVNPRLTQIIGRPEGALLGTGWLDCLEPVGRARLLAAVAAGEIVDGRPRRVAATGTGGHVRWLGICLHPVDDVVGGDIIGIVEELGATVQASRRVQAAEHRAVRSRRHAAYLADRLAETHRLTRSGTWDLDPETGMIIMSPGLRDLLRLPAATVRPEQVWRRVHPEDVARLAALAKRVRSTGAPAVTELRVADMDGVVHDLIVSCRVAEPQGHPAGSTATVWGVVQDVTGIRQAERDHLQAEAAWLAEWRTVDTFRRAALPPALPDIAGVDLAARYLPAPDRLDVGTGWYDAMPVPGGGVLLSVGEVAGHDRHAAAAMTPVLAALRAYAVEDPDPARLLARLNRLLTGTRQDDTFATAVAALYEPDTGELSLANAGHPAPLVISPGHAGDPVVTSLAPASPALGILPEAEFPEQRLALPAGAALCVHTDGLTEPRGDPMSPQTGLLPFVAARAFRQIAGDRRRHRPAARLADHIIRAMLGSDPPDDDICLAVLWTDALR